MEIKAETKEEKTLITSQWKALFEIIINENFLPKDINNMESYTQIYNKMEPIFVTYKFGDNMWLKYHYIVMEILNVLNKDHYVWLMSDLTNIPKCLKGEGVYGTNFIARLTDGSIPKQYENILIPNEQENGVHLHIDIENVKKVNLEMIEKKLWKMFIKQYDPHGLVYKTYVMPNYMSRKSNYYSQIKSCTCQGQNC
jgi:hypothetical protein